jgi:hypothetical protein
LDAETVSYLTIAAAGLVALAAYGYFILVPAWTAYGRKWERVAAALLTLFVLAAFAGTGLGIGLVLVYYWDDLTSTFALAEPLARGLVSLWLCTGAP